MAATGNSKADFSLTIGLNMDDLFQGMNEADATINQAISRINSENKQVKLKADTSEIKAVIVTGKQIVQIGRAHV